MFVRHLHGLTGFKVQSPVPFVVGLDPLLIDPPPINGDHLSFTSSKLSTTLNHILLNRTSRKLRQGAMTTLRPPQR
jgi:hypothetical protein